MPEDAVLTVLWTDRAEQRHLLLMGAGTPAEIHRWLQSHRAELDQGFEAGFPDPPWPFLPESDLKRLLSAGHPQLHYRYLLTISARRRRTLLSAWIWHAASGCWLRLWRPCVVMWLQQSVDDEANPPHTRGDRPTTNHDGCSAVQRIATDCARERIVADARQVSDPQLEHT